MVRLFKLTFVVVLACFSIEVFAQGSLKGIVKDEQGYPLFGAYVQLDASNKGDITDENGAFEISNVAAGEQTVIISFTGYEEIRKSVTVGSAEVDLDKMSMRSTAVGMDEIKVIAGVARDRETPVAVTSIRKIEIENRTGNQEFPEVMRRVPSIYVTKTGGGFGDSRINIRGFDQSNTAVMINGIPVNDMENGWVYWSNWAGLTDIASDVQVQRGLGASKLAVPSVGGSINLITNPAERSKSTTLRIGVGNDGYNKFGLAHSTGLMNDKWALSLLFTRTAGNGYVNGTEFEAYNYFAAFSYKLNDKHTIALTALGAPQVHNQRTYESFYPITLQTYKDKGIKYNELYGELNGEEFSWRKNFYHKPKVWLNHYWNISDKTSLNTSAYVSFGRGGGTGPRGRANYDVDGDGNVDLLFDSNPVWRNADGTVRFDDIVAWQSGANTELNNTWGTPRNDPQYGNYTTSSGDGLIRRGSMNYHNWYGILSTLSQKVNKNIDLTFGIDARYYKGEHFRRLENLLGLDAYQSRAKTDNGMRFITEADAADFFNFHNSSYQDTINVLNYWNDGLVTWAGAFGQIEYHNEKLSAFLTLTGNQQGFKRIDYFNYKADDTPDNDYNDDGEHIESDWQNFLGGVVKGGVNYNINGSNNVFLNLGYQSRPPLFDVVFINFRNQVNENAQNQTISSIEAGYGLRKGILTANLNLYHTIWNRQFDQSFDYVYTEGSMQGQQVNALAIFQDVRQIHQGFELEVKADVTRMVALDAMVSVGNWRYADDFVSQSTDTDNNLPIESDTIYVKDLKVGDAAQTSLNVGATIRPVKGLSIYTRYFYFDNLYAQFRVDGNSFRTPGQDVVQLPAYGLLDAGASYRKKLGKYYLTIFANINNVLDTEYVSEVYTNIQDDPATEADEFYNNQGFYGFGMTWNAGIKLEL